MSQARADLAPIPPLRHAPPEPDEPQALSRRLASLESAPSVTLVAHPGDRSSRAIDRTLKSLAALVYEPLEVLHVGPPATSLAAAAGADAAGGLRFRWLAAPGCQGEIALELNQSLEQAAGEFVGFVATGDTLSPRALLVAAEGLRRHPRADCVYTDEDTLTDSGLLVDPYFKPDWSPMLLLAQPYILRLALYRTRALRELGGVRQGFAGSWQHDLALRFVERAAEVAHVPEPVYHCRPPSARRWRLHLSPRQRRERRREAAAARRAVEEGLARRGRRGRVWPSGAPGVSFVSIAPREAAPVSILIPSRDRAGLLRRCVKSVLGLTRYARFEILVIDNDSREPAALTLLQRLSRRPAVRILHAPGAFNFSALVNQGARASEARFLLLLNNDTEVMAPGWLAEMVALAEEPGTGAVGAKLHYPDGSIQHAGIVLGLGSVASHPHKRFPRHHPGYHGLLQSLREVSAVTGACLLTPRATYLELGGFEERLPRAYNDVDYCLRLLARGRRVLFTPLAELYHHESASRGPKSPADADLREAAAFMEERWGKELREDRYYSPRLSRRSTNFALREEEV